MPRVATLCTRPYVRWGQERHIHRVFPSQGHFCPVLVKQDLYYLLAGSSGSLCSSCDAATGTAEKATPACCSP